jgi:flagellar biogenesis protein FliO
VVDFWDSFIRMTSSLALVLALMAGLVLLVRRFAGTRLGAQVGTPIVQVLGSGYIGPRKTISLVSVAGELIIVGMTPTDLVSLGPITDRERVQQFLSMATPSRSSAPDGPSFHERTPAQMREGTAETRGGDVG